MQSQHTTIKQTHMAYNVSKIFKKCLAYNTHDDALQTSAESRVDEILTSGQRFLTIGRIAGANFSRWHRPVGRNAVGCSSRADAVIDFLLRTQQQRRTILFNGPDNPKRLPLHSGSGLPSNGSFGPPESPTLAASRSVRPFCRAHERDRQTDTQTTLLRL